MEADSAQEYEGSPVQDEALDLSFRELCALLARMDDQELVYDFFGCLFTAAERKDFAKRWSLVKELHAGTTQREIARKYNMSLCNITRGSRELKKENSAFRKVLDAAGGIPPQDAPA